MKNVKNLLLTGAVCSMLFLGACKDDTTDPVPGGGSNTKSCKIASTTDSDGASTVYTWDGDKIAKIVEDSDGDITTYNYNYEGGKLTEIVEDWDGDITSYKIIYTGNNISRVDVYYDGDLYEYYNVKLNADGSLMMVDNFIKDMEDMLYASYEYTYTDGKLTKIVETEDADDNGVLDGEDDVYTYTVNAVDNKVNPLYGIPNYLMDFTDFTSLLKNNLNAATMEAAGIPIPIAITYEYNSDDLPSKATTNFLGESLVVNMTYKCD